MAGVGGQTVEEAQNTLSYSEFLSWVEYRNKYGVLSQNRKIEQMVGFMIYNIALIHGNKHIKPYDFMPYEKEIYEKMAKNSDRLTVEDLKEMLKDG